MAKEERKMISVVFIAIVLLLCLPKSSWRWKGLFDDGLSLQNTIPVRGIAALCIIFTHTGLVPFFNHGYLFVGVFFFFSGFGVMQGLLHKPDYLKTFFRRRFPSLLVPYYTMTALYLAVFFFSNFCPPADLLLYSLLPPLAVFTKNSLIVPASWYVAALLFFYTFFAVFFRCFRFSRAFLLTAVGVCLYCVVCKHFGKGIPWYGTTFLFLLGILFAQYASAVHSFISKRYGVLLLVFLLLFPVVLFADEHVSLFAPFFDHKKLIKFFTHQCVTTCFVAVVILFLYKVRLGSPVFRFLGKISFELYLCHQIVIQILDNSYLGASWKLSVFSLHWDFHVGVILCTIFVSIPLASGMHRLNGIILDRLKRKGLG